MQEMTQTSDDSIFTGSSLLNITLRLVESQPSRDANNESSKVFDIIKPGQRVKIKGYRYIRA